MSSQIETLCLLFLSLLVFSTSTWAQTQPRKSMMLLDYNDPDEVNEWIEKMGLKPNSSKTPCPNQADYCNDKFVAYRPMAKTIMGGIKQTSTFSDSEEMAKWFTQQVDATKDFKPNEKMLPPDGMIITGHHYGYFFGKNGTLYVKDFARELNELRKKVSFVYLGGCNTSLNYSTTDNPIHDLNQLLQKCKDGKATNEIKQILQLMSDKGLALWSQTFPAATVVGFNGKTTSEESKRLIHQIAEKLKKQGSTLSEYLYSRIGSEQEEEVRKKMDPLLESLNKMNAKASYKKACSECDFNYDKNDDLPIKEFDSIISAVSDEESDLKCLENITQAEKNILLEQMAKILTNRDYYLPTTGKETEDKLEDDYLQYNKELTTEENIDKRRVAYRLLGSMLYDSEKSIKQAVQDLTSPNTGLAESAAFLIAKSQTKLIEKEKLLQITSTGLKNANLVAKIYYCRMLYGNPQLKNATRSELGEHEKVLLEIIKKNQHHNGEDESNATREAEQALQFIRRLK